MRFMILVKASADSEAGRMPSEKELLEMGRFNESLIKAGVLLAGDGLHPSSKGARIRTSRTGDVTVIDGPFAETKELISGYWIVQARSLEEVIELFRTCPPEVGELEIRRMFDAADFEPAIETEAGRELLRAEEEFRNRQNG